MTLGSHPIMSQILLRHYHTCSKILVFKWSSVGLNMCLALRSFGLKVGLCFYWVELSISSAIQDGSFTRLKNSISNQSSICTLLTKEKEGSTLKPRFGICEAKIILPCSTILRVETIIFDHVWPPHEELSFKIPSFIG